MNVMQPHSTDSPVDSEGAPIDPRSMLAEHAAWLGSDGTRGRRADLRCADLSGRDLSGADLRFADLRGANLQRTDLRHCRLDYADLTECRGLLTRQLAGADLTGCRVPESTELDDPLEQLQDHIVSARKIMLAMILGIGYLWLTIGTTTDVDLLTNSASSPLPIINTRISFTGFYLAAPLLLVGAYLYLHIQQQRLWETLSELPARYPSGRTLEQRALPWLLGGLLNAHCPRLSEARPTMSRIQNGIGIALAWYAVPISLAAVWLRFAPRHDWIGTVYHSGLLVLCILCGILFYNQSVATLNRMGESPTLRDVLRVPRSRPLLAVTEIALLAVALVGVPLFSWGMMPPEKSEPLTAAHPQSWVPSLLNAVGYRAHADFSDMDVSERPTEWSEETPPLDRVRGANLRGVNLRRAQASRAFLVRGNLQNADLREADLEAADLRGAQLSDADLSLASLLLARLEYANLSDAILDGAQLVGARMNDAELRRIRLNGAFLNRAELVNADLEQADLRGAVLHGARLTGAKLDRAILAEAQLEGVDLRLALGLTCGQIRQATTNQETQLPAGLGKC